VNSILSQTAEIVSSVGVKFLLKVCPPLSRSERILLFV